MCAWFVYWFYAIFTTIFPSRHLLIGDFLILSWKLCEETNLNCDHSIGCCSALNILNSSALRSCERHQTATSAYLFNTKIFLYVCILSVPLWDSVVKGVTEPPCSTFRFRIAGVRVPFISISGASSRKKTLFSFGCHLSSKSYANNTVQPIAFYRGIYLFS